MNLINNKIKPIIHRQLLKSPLKKNVPLLGGMIEVTTRCNLKCDGCFRTENEYPSKNKDMSFEDYKFYIDRLQPVLSLRLYGQGEPTLNKCLPKMVEYAVKKRKAKSFDIITNLIVDDTKIYDALYKRGIIKLWCSVNSMVKDEAEQLRKGTDFNLLVKNLKYLTDRYDIWINFVVSKKNIRTFHNSIKRLARFRLKRILLQHFFDKGNDSNCLDDNEKMYLFNKGIELDKQYDFQISTSPYLANVRPCNIINSYTITVDGFVLPCCEQMNHNIFNFGNLKAKSFEEIHYSSQMRSWQESMDKGVYPDYCKKCPANHSYNDLKMSNNIKIMPQFGAAYCNQCKKILRVCDGDIINIQDYVGQSKYEFSIGEEI